MGGDPVGPSCFARSLPDSRVESAFAWVSRFGPRKLPKVAQVYPPFIHAQGSSHFEPPPPLFLFFLRRAQVQQLAG